MLLSPRGPGVVFTRGKVCPARGRTIDRRPSFLGTKTMRLLFGLCSSTGRNRHPGEGAAARSGLSVFRAGSRLTLPGSRSILSLARFLLNQNAPRTCHPCVPSFPFLTLPCASPAGPTVRATGPQVAPAMGSAPWTPGPRGWGPGRECQSLLKPAVTRRGVGASRRSQSRPQVSRAGLAAGAGPGGGRQQGRSSAPGCHAALRAHWRWPWCWAPRSRQRRGALATLLPGR